MTESDDRIQAARRFEAAMERVKRQGCGTNELAAALYRVESAFAETGLSAKAAVKIVQAVSPRAK